MTKVLLDMAMSLDGFISTSDGSDAGLYDWYFDESNPVDHAAVKEIVDISGAIVMGRGAFGLGEDSGGFDDTPYDVDHFVITHRPPATPPGNPRIRFVTTGIEDAIAAAKKSASDRYATVGGGADIAQQLLEAGLVDEIQLHIAPIVLGTGLPLFTGLTNRLDLRQTRAIAGERALHVWYEVTKSAT